MILRITNYRIRQARELRRGDQYTAARNCPVALVLKPHVPDVLVNSHWASILELGPRTRIGPKLRAWIHSFDSERPVKPVNIRLGPKNLEIV